jgi:hypothetical protein
MHLLFLVLMRRPFENVLSAISFTILLTSIAWPMWITLKPMHRRIDEINMKTDVLHASIQVFVILVHVLAYH